MKKNNYLINSIAQGTIEYLVIISVVVVVSLVVVGIVVNQVDNVDSSLTSNQQITLVSDLVGISNVLINSEGVATLNVKNNDSTNITVKKIFFNEYETEFNKILFPQENQSFTIPTEFICNSEKTNFDIKVIYVTREGLEKNRVLKNIVTLCQDYTIKNPLSGKAVCSEFFSVDDCTQNNCFWEREGSCEDDPYLRFDCWGIGGKDECLGKSPVCNWNISGLCNSICEGLGNSTCENTPGCNNIDGGNGYCELYNSNLCADYTGHGEDNCISVNCVWESGTETCVTPNCDEFENEASCNGMGISPCEWVGNGGSCESEVECDGFWESESSCVENEMCYWSGYQECQQNIYNCNEISDLDLCDDIDGCTVNITSENCIEKN